MNALVKVPKGAAGALLCMNQTVEQFASALAIADRYGRQWNASICSIGVVGEPHSVDTARKIHRGFLAALAEMNRAYNTLWQVTTSHPAVDRATALAMLNVLFAAIGKRKSDEESTILLAAAVDMFNPVNDVLRCVIGGEAIINRHPLVLTIAIKKLIATAKFTSCAELREAMAKVANSISIDVWRLEYIAAAIDRADVMLFEKDRAAWNAAYANVGSDVVRRMLDLAELGEEGPYEEDGELPATPGSPRWQALDELYKAESKQRLAACEMKPAKRTRKPKQIEPVDA